jgi:Na+-transporting NADH:ubiquinone oxidoreductase subunit C
MAVNKNSNGYTFLFSTVMVVVVGAALAITSQSLKPLQTKNDADKKRIDILGAIQVKATRENAAQMFDQYVVERVAINYNGDVLNSKTGAIDAADKNDPFNVDIQKEYRADVKKIVKESGKNQEEMAARLSAAPVSFPLFKCNKDGEVLYVIPVVGTGLWGPIWGYVALKDDKQTIYGAKFDHKTETPGLGAEIKESFFQEKFENKTLNTSSETVFSVVKGGAPTNEHSVDGITGGTVTSKGVDEMINRTLKVYIKYFESVNNQRAQR